VHLGKTLHPPGKATALIAAVGWPGRGSAGYLYVLLPVELGVTVLLLAGLALDNLPKGRRYSELWL
jgi:CBS-domain-containing membrane protein